MIISDEIRRNRGGRQTSHFLFLRQCCATCNSGPVWHGTQRLNQPAGLLGSQGPLCLTSWQDDKKAWIKPLLVTGCKFKPPKPWVTWIEWSTYQKDITNSLMSERYVSVCEGKTDRIPLALICYGNACQVSATRMRVKYLRQVYSTYSQSDAKGCLKVGWKQE